MPTSDLNQTVKLLDGRTVRRELKLWIPEWKMEIMAAQYDKHFIYANNVVNQPSYMCTCGSPAGVVPRGPFGTFQCLALLDNGRHNGS